MKKPILIFFAIIGLNLCYSQGAGLTKEETINYINKKLQETHEMEYKYDFQVIYKESPRETHLVKKMYIISNAIELNNNGTISHFDRMASSLSSCHNKDEWYYGSQKSKVSFNPIHITNMKITEGNDLKLGILEIDFLANTEKWEKPEYQYKITTQKATRYFSHNDWFTGKAVYENEYKDIYNCETYNGQNVPTGKVHIYFLKSDPENGKKLIKAFNYLIDLYKAEDDPFGD